MSQIVHLRSDGCEFAARFATAPKFATDPDAIIGGYVYRGPMESPQSFLFIAISARTAPFPLSISRASVGATLNKDRQNSRTAEFRPVDCTVNAVVSLSVDRASNLYLVNYDGEIYRAEGQ